MPKIQYCCTAMASCDDVKGLDGSLPNCQYISHCKTKRKKEKTNPKG